MDEVPNLDYICKLSAGDGTVKNKLINILKEEFPQDVINYYRKINNHELIEASQNVHKIKHKIMILGLVEDYNLSIKHELSLKENNIFFKEDFEIILKKISDYIIKIQE
jgi:hypothetical protein